MTIELPENKEDRIDAAPMPAHYNFDYGKAKPNRFADRLNRESVMVVLDPDIALIFPTAEAVNDALRVLAAALEQLPKPKAT